MEWRSKPQDWATKHVRAIPTFNIYKPDVAKLGLQSVDRFNIAPQSQVVLRVKSGEHELTHWGIPLAGSSRQIMANARSETLDSKPLFRDLSRCAFLANGWYEWQRSGSKKQP